MTDRRPVAQDRLTVRAIGTVAAVQAALRIAPLVIQALGGHGLPTPGTLNDPASALAILRNSPDVPIVAALICATGITQVVVVVWLAGQIRERAPQHARLSVIFGVIAASFLMIDGALGMTALPQLARLDPGQATVDGAYLAILGIRNGIDRVIPLTLGIWALAAHWPAWRHRFLARPLAILGLLLGVAGVAGAVSPAAGLVSLILAILWTTVFTANVFRNDVGPLPTLPQQEGHVSARRGR